MLSDYEIELKKQVSYDPLTGILTRISKPFKSKAELGPIKGSVKKEGHLRVSIHGVEKYFHQIAWFLHYGVWATQIIDHEDGDPTNNRILNLREVTKLGNLHNQRRAHHHSKSGLLGAHFRKDKKKFESQIWAEGVRHRLGYFDTAEEAHHAYVIAKRQLHATCTL